MSQKNDDNLGQTIRFQYKSHSNYPKSSSLELLRSHGIPLTNTTKEKLTQTTLVFTNMTKPPVEDDSIEASIRYLKFKRFNP
jgi:hypothetical protein